MLRTLTLCKMTLYRCKNCGTKLYSASSNKAGGICFCCDKGPLEIHGAPATETVTITLDKRDAEIILKKLADIAEDAEYCYRKSKDFNPAYAPDHEAYMLETRRLHSSFYRALQEAQSWKQP